MPVIVKNTGPIEETAQGHKNTNPTKAKDDQGTVRVIIEKMEYVFGPNEQKSFADDGIGKAVAAADARLRLVDTRDAAWPTSNASILQHIT